MTVLTQQSQNLQAESIPLTGIHLIEASAGTGKTYNITRIYLRMLLERKLTVQQILVMTFTKDATEEIKGRIDDFIRYALNHWAELIQNDGYFNAIAKNITEQEAKLLLNKALLFLDEAAIFTIHGFCKTVLTEHAFETGISFNVDMEGDQQSLILQSIQDWYRQLASDEPNNFLRLVQFWPVPQSFYRHFAKAINKNCGLTVPNSDRLIAQFKELAGDARSTLLRNQAFLYEQLVDNKPTSEQVKRDHEFNGLINWLEEVITDHRYVNNKIPDAFIDGRRYAKMQNKSQLVNIFSPVNQVKGRAKTLIKEVEKVEALTIVHDGIIHIRTNVNEQKEALNVLSFDDLITTLSKQLSSPQGAELANILATKYPVALIDEFQDTDPDQFTILKQVYYHRPQHALMMIGDPKQAIYGFRGGDVFAYMKARDDCDYQWMMDTNWRSTLAMINGYNRLFYGANLQDRVKDVFGYHIPYHPVKPSPKAKQAVLENDEDSSALSFIYFDVQSDKKHVLQNYRSDMATWCANEIIDLISHQNTDTKDIAILVRDGAEAKDIKQALFNAGLPSVYLSNRANLLHSEQTTQLIQLLTGILHLEDERLFSASLACELLPYSPAEFHQLKNDDLAWQQMKINFSQLRHEWITKGFITMALTLMHDHMSISGADSERILTNVLHLFELLQKASQHHRQPQSLLYWLEQQHRSDNPELETELRLESEENLIKIVTQHGSKGLEYPVVFVPFVTRYKNSLKFASSNVQLIEYHDDSGALNLSLYGSDDEKQRMADEAYAETIRLLYVAVTRAERRCYLCCSAFENYHLSPLGLTLKWEKGQSIQQSIQQVVNDAPKDISLLTVNSDIEPNTCPTSTEKTVVAKVCQFHGKIERDWWLSSFTALSRNIRNQGVSSPDRDNSFLLSDDDRASDVGLTSNEALYQSSFFQFTLAKGANTGNLLHDILEHLNFSEPDWPTALKWPLVKYGELAKGVNSDELQRWLEQVITAPLFSINEGVNEPLSLSMLPYDQTLREAEFYYPLDNVDTGKLSQLLIEHRRNSIFDIGNSEQFVVSYHQYLKGMMHGFIDLIFEHQGQYFICDYKSNHLGDEFSDYLPEKLQQNIVEHHYDLQYLIYSLALHRYLTLTKTDYQPQQHFGGVFYLYLRGMGQTINGELSGVYYRDILVDELLCLDQLFSGNDDGFDRLIGQTSETGKGPRL